MMNVWINNQNLEHRNIVLLRRTIAPAAVKRAEANIPYRDGTIDLTKALSNTPHYQNRQITMEFEVMQHIGHWEKTRSELYDEFHGEKVTVTFGDDLSYFWEGLCEIGEIEYHGFTAGLKITITAHPFKRTKMPIVTRVFSITGETEETFFVPNRKGYASFTVAQSVIVSDGVENYNITPTQNTAYGLNIVHGENTLTFTGSGSVVMSIYGGDL